MKELIKDSSDSRGLFKKSDQNAGGLSGVGTKDIKYRVARGTGIKMLRSNLVSVVASDD